MIYTVTRRPKTAQYRTRRDARDCA